ncbi:MAG: hypothetical protein AMXMBFR57_32080 [Acidimicrobiia bacterium]
MPTFLRRLIARIKYRHFDRDLEQELASHREMVEADLRARGLSMDDARPAASRTLGNVTYMREEARSVWIARWMEQLWQDMRYASRTARKSPGFSLGAVLILALGVSTLTTGYSMVNASLLRPWQVADPDSVIIIRARPAPQQQRGSLSIDEALYLADHATTVSALTTFINGGQRVGDDGPDVQSLYVTERYFDVMGTPVISGPGFTRGGSAKPGTREVVISDHLWKTYFNSDPTIAGRTVRLSSQPYTVVGVAQPGFEDVSRLRIHLWMSLTSSGFGELNGLGGLVVARLTPGASAGHALAELEQLSRQFRHARSIPSFGLRVTDTRPISNNQPAIQQEYLYIFAALVLVLVLTCFNVGSLLLARSLKRHREVAIRLSLGAGRWRVARQQLTEAFLLTATAGGLGVALAYAAPRILVALSGSTLMRTAYFEPDWTVFAFSLGISGFAAVLAGGAAARSVRRVSPIRSMRGVHGPDRDSSRTRGLLMAAQVAIAVVFLTGAGLVGRAAITGATADPGFAVDDVALVRVSFREALSRERQGAFTRDFGRAIETAGLTNVAFTQSPPLIKGASTSIRLHRPGEHPTAATVVSSRPVSANYFDVMRIPVVAGVVPDGTDAAHTLAINESAARRLWPDADAVGQSVIRPNGKESIEYRIAAVVRDVPIRSVGLLEPVVYQFADNLPLTLVADPQGDTLEKLRSLARSVEPSSTLQQTSVRDLVRESFDETATASRVGWMIGFAALLISMLGTYGVFSYSVEERRREIGIRLALGGTAGHVRREVLRAGQHAVVFGLTTGFVLCGLTATLLRHQLFGLQPMDIATYVKVAVILFAATMTALWIPARRAIRVDPSVTLRND